MTENTPPDFPSAEEAIKLMVDTYMLMAQHASDIAYAKRVMFDAYILEGFSPEMALELCKGAMV